MCDLNAFEWTEDAIRRGHRSRLTEEFQILPFARTRFRHRVSAAAGSVPRGRSLTARLSIAVLLTVRLPAECGPTKGGREGRRFQLASPSGATVRLSEEVKRGPVVLYRRARVPGPADGLDMRAKEFIAGKTFPAHITLVLDPNYTFTNRHGLRWDAPNETAYPSTFLIGKYSPRSGFPRWAYHRRRDAAGGEGVAGRGYYP